MHCFKEKCPQKLRSHGSDTLGYTVYMKITSIGFQIIYRTQIDQSYLSGWIVQTNVSVQTPLHSQELAEFSLIPCSTICESNVFYIFFLSF